MAYLRIGEPDLIEYIDLKQKFGENNEEFTNFLEENFENLIDI